MSYKVTMRGAPTRHEQVEYRCTSCSRVTEVFEERSASPQTVPCPNPACEQGGAERIFSAPMVGTNWAGDVVRGAHDERQHKAVMDTRPLAEGMPMGEWKKKRREMYRDKDIAEIKAKVG